MAESLLEQPSSDSSGARTSLFDAVAPGSRDLVVVANRLPVQRVGDHWRASPGGLVRAMIGVLRSRHGAWIGWSGTLTDGDGSAASPHETDMQFLATAAASSQCNNAGPHGDDTESDIDPDIEMVQVPLSAHDFAHYYERVSNAALWPLFHDAIRESTFDAESWSVYQDVNRRFAEAAAAAVAPDGTVWVHDYHLVLVPAMLRTLRPDVKIGYFLHIPFPPQELFMRMPWREEVLDGLLGADVIGFQRHVGAENFVAVARRLVDAEIDGGDDDGGGGGEPGQLRIRTSDGRRVLVGTFPISIDVDEIEQIAALPETSARAMEIRDRLGQAKTIFLGVDRLDYTKGIDLRLESFRSLLEDADPPAGPIPRPICPTVLIQVAVPGREGVESYVDERRTIEQLVGDINGQYGSIGYPVVHYLRRNLDLAELVALYMAADVMVVTPRRDGMNLVAKEFVASRLDDTGVLILSEFAGAADELTEAVLVNPHDPDAIVTAMRAAMSMPLDVAQRRMHELRASVLGHTVSDWAESFLDALGREPYV